MEHCRISAGSGQLLVGVSRTWLETPRVKVIELVSLDGAELPSFTPGAHVDLHLPDGCAPAHAPGACSPRSYSLCGDPADRALYRLAILAAEDGAGVSGFIHRSLAAGDRLVITPPRNHFPLTPGDRPIVLIAGGIGITPLLSMAYALSQSSHPYHLYYFVRDPAEVAFAGMLQQGALSERVTIIAGRSPDRPGPADLLSQHEVADVYCCGPVRLMNAARQAAAARGFAYRAEAFVSPSSPVDMLADDAAGFEIELARSGRRFRVPSDTSISAVLHAQGIAIETMCENGYCGTCLTAVLAGEIEHRDSILTDEERGANNMMAICCSRAKGSLLVLDI